MALTYPIAVFGGLAKISLVQNKQSYHVRLDVHALVNRHVSVKLQQCVLAGILATIGESRNGSSWSPQALTFSDIARAYDMTV